MENVAKCRTCITEFHFFRRIQFIKKSIYAQHFSQLIQDKLIKLQKRYRTGIKYPFCVLESFLLYINNKIKK